LHEVDNASTPAGTFDAWQQKTWHLLFTKQNDSIHVVVSCVHNAQVSLK
jgi:hypothetical protein